MPKNIAGKLFIAIALLSQLACNGSGGSSNHPPDHGFPGSPEAPDTPNGEELYDVELSWQIPDSRANDDPLLLEDIQGYVLIGFSENQIDEFLKNNDIDASSINFQDNREEIAYLLFPALIEKMVSEDSPNVVILTDGSQTSYPISNLYGGSTSYVAISTVDSENRYSVLAETLKIVTPE